MFYYISIYTIIGLIWASWLEYFTTNKLEGKYGQPWQGSERVFHITLWPYSLGTFIYGFFKEFFKNL